MIVCPRKVLRARRVGQRCTSAFRGASTGTTIAFNPPNGQDTINLKHQCITAMKEYKNKSLEELHVEDYKVNHKYKQAGLTSTLFGQTSATSAFGGASAGVVPVGTTIAFNSPIGRDTMMKSGVTTNIKTKHQCITSMKEYKNKSLEELRVEDYNANRKSKQADSKSTFCLFGSTPATQASTGFVINGGLGSGLQTSTTGFGIFGSTNSAATTPFSHNRPLFGTATTTQSGFGFGSSTATQPSTSLFGSPARSLFGRTTSTQPSLTGGSSFFGTPASGASNPVGFGASTQSMVATSKRITTQHTCTKCHKSFTLPLNLIRHMNTHRHIITVKSLKHTDKTTTRSAPSGSVHPLSAIAAQPASSSAGNAVSHMPAEPSSAGNSMTLPSSLTNASHVHLSSSVTDIFIHLQIR